MTVNPSDSAIFGNLFGTAEMRALFADRQHLQYMLDVEAALARVQARLGIVPQDAAEAISAAASVDRLSLDEIATSTQIVGYPVVALVKALGTLAGTDAARYAHWGATTQDIIDTALVLQICAGLDLVERGVGTVVRALAERATRHRGDVMAGRTHLQHALPITFGGKCAVWLAPLLDDIERLRQLRPRVLKVQFGGAVGTLASLGTQGRAVTVALAQELGLGTPDAPWHVSRGALVEATGILGMICGNLAKFATDIILLMQTEIAEVFEPHQADRQRIHHRGRAGGARARPPDARRHGARSRARHWPLAERAARPAADFRPDLGCAGACRDLGGGNGRRCPAHAPQSRQ